MDSEDESRPGSSASNSSDSSDDNNSDNNSRASSPEAPKRSKSGSVKSAASVKSTTSMKSNGSGKSGSASPQSGGERAISRSSRVSSRSSRASSKSNSGSSSSSSSSSSDEDDDAGSAKEAPKSPSKPVSSRSSSEESGTQQRQGAVSRNQSISPVRRKSRSSRNSSVSSAGGSLDDHREDGAINMSHEDLSDVSEMDSEKRLDHNNRENTKMSMDDEATNGSVSNANEPVRQQEHDEVEDKEEKPTEENNSRHSRNDDDDDDDDEDDNAGEVPKREEKKPNKDDEKDHEKDSDNREKEQEKPHEDDDLEESIITDLRQKLDKKKACLQKLAEENNETSCGNKNNGNLESDLDDLVKKHDEDALDFEAEEGECPEVSKEEQEKIDQETAKAKDDESKKSDGEAEEGEELEEGEVSDEDEKRPEETEPKPVCRFYTRGQCTWGMSCRFLHPGVTDKGNYTMFDMVRPVSVPSGGGGGGGGRPQLGAGFGHDNYHDFRSERPPLHHRAPPLLHHPAIPFVPHHDPRAIPPVIAPEPPIVESAWERGLRTAKEMMRKANKRKEQDMDFEDKKMNLTLSPEDVEKDNYYIKDRATPPEAVPQYPRHQNYQEPPGLYPPSDRFARGPPPIYDDLDPYGRSARYRELPAHRMPHYEDERRVRPAREVIVQRVEPVGRGDEWNDPWMRSKSPGGRALSDRERSDKRRRDRRSYSSNSSYSSSTSSQSDSSSESSRSPSPENRRRYNSGSHKSPPARRHFRTGGGGGLRSPSPRRPRRSPSIARSPAAKRRGHSSPSPDKRAVYSPSNRKRRASPPLKRSGIDRTKKQRRGSSSSGSGSSDSSGSGSDSSSSSSESSSQSRGTTPVKRVRTIDKIANERKAVKKVETVKKRSPISIEIKKQATVGASALTSPSNSNSSDKPEVKDMKKNRREELLKQLRAVEDAIAKKRSKLT